MTPLYFGNKGDEISRDAFTPNKLYIYIGKLKGKWPHKHNVQLNKSNLGF